jgi:aminobenzoyl-glutamate utilization protein B
LLFRTFRSLIVVIASLLTVTTVAQQPPAATPDPRLDQFKRDVGLEVDGLGEMVQRMNDQVFSFAELGFQEFETSKYLTGILRQNGFSIQENLAVESLAVCSSDLLPGRSVPPRRCRGPRIAVEGSL